MEKIKSSSFKDIKWKIIKYIAHLYFFVLGRIRSKFYTLFFEKVGKGVFIFPPFRCTSPEGIVVGNNVCFSTNCTIGGEGGLDIGNFVMIGNNVSIFTSNHGWKDLTIPMLRQNIKPEPVKIYDDVWIGANVVILPGVIVGQGAIIGAGSVVSVSVDPYSIVAGVPARIIGNRSDDQEFIEFLHNSKKSPLYNYYDNDFLETSKPKIFQKKL